MNWQALPADVPEPIRRLLGRCLEKDPKRRLRDIGEARITLEDPASAVPAVAAVVAGTQAPALQAFIDTPSIEKHSSFSPDGRWLAYMAAPPGGSVNEVFVQPFPPTGAKYQVSGAGARAPVWSPDGKRLFFHNSGPNRIFVVDVNGEHGLTFGTPVPIPLDGTIHPSSQRNYDVTPDGTQLIVVLPPQAAQSTATRRTSARSTWW